MNRFYCNSRQIRKALSLLFAAPFPSCSHKGQHLNVYEDKVKLWRSKKSFPYGPDITLIREMRIQMTFVSKMSTQQSVTLVLISESSSQAMRQQILEHELQSQHSKEILPTNHAELRRQ